MRRKYKLAIIAAVFISLLVPGSSLLAKEKRYALVIGNGSYRSSPLANSVNDANDIADALKKCGFKVAKAIDADRITMRKAIRDFGQNISKKDAVGLFYYAGHGLQVNGENFVIPIGADVYSEDEVEDECLKMSSVLRKMEAAGNRINIIILDACRDNPFARSFRSGNKGLAKMDAPSGSLLAYATAPGSVAADGIGRNGLYTASLLKYMLEPGVPIERVFKQVRISVMNGSDSKQVPWESSSMTGDFYFVQVRGVSVKGMPSLKKKAKSKYQKADEEEKRVLPLPSF